MRQKQRDPRPDVEEHLSRNDEYGTSTMEYLEKLFAGGSKEILHQVTVTREKVLELVECDLIGRPLEVKCSWNREIGYWINVHSKSYSFRLPTVSDEGQPIRLGDRVELVSPIPIPEISIDQEKLLKVLEEQSETLCRVFRQFRMAPPRMSPWGRDIHLWERTRCSLIFNPELLRLALKMQQPTLLYKPYDSDPANIIHHLNCYNSAAKLHTDFWEPHNYELWGKKKSTELVYIVEGKPNLKPEIENYQNLSYCEIRKVLLQQCMERGFSPINNLDIYLILTMKSLAEGEPIDSQSCTLLNAENLPVNSLIPYGCSRDNRVCLRYADPYDFPDEDFAIREMIEVDIS